MTSTLLLHTYDGFGQVLTTPGYQLYVRFTSLLRSFRYVSGLLFVGESSRLVELFDHLDRVLPDALIGNIDVVVHLGLPPDGPTT